MSSSVLCVYRWPASNGISELGISHLSLLRTSNSSILFNKDLFLVQRGTLNHRNPQHTLIKNSVLDSRFSFHVFIIHTSTRPSKQSAARVTLWVTLRGPQVSVAFVWRVEKLLIEWHLSSFFGSLLALFFSVFLYNYSLALFHIPRQKMNLCPAMKISSH